MHRFHLRVKLAHGCDVQRSFHRYNDSYSNFALAHCERVIRRAHIKARLRTRLLTDAEFLRRPDYAWTTSPTSCTSTT